MEVLIFILIVVFFAVSDKKNKQKKGQAAGRPRNAAEAKALAKAQAEAKLRAARARQAAEAKPEADVRPGTDARPAVKVQSKAPVNVKPVKVASQQSPVFMAAKAPSLLDEIDEEGCVGGSMAHTHDEGESREEHRRHVESALQRDAEEALASQAAVELEAVNLQRLRQAVIMAEVLDRPKALRRKY